MTEDFRGETEEKRPSSLKKIFFVSLGCDKNTVDTEHMLGALPGDEYQLTNEEREADVIVVNTCAFIDAAKEESIETILEMAENKTQGRCRALIVAGCMAERYRREVLEELPEVDAVLGTGSFDRIDEAVHDVLDGKRRLILDDPIRNSAPEKQQTRKKRVITTGGHYEYLKIAEGCDKHCTYCVIPSLRGPYRSTPMPQLLEEARELADEGVRELILIAEETTRYGIDLYGKKSLHLLLKELCRIDGIHWIRILYCYPEEIYPELIEVMRDEPKICHYLDLPIQHASDRILKKMGRKTTRADLIRLIGTLRREIPDIALRTTLISGFPSETDEDQKELLDFVRQIRFDRLGVFCYSREEGTPASGMEGQIAPEEKEKRRDEILLAQQEISLEKGEELIGKKMEVQVEGYLAADEVYACRTYRDTPDVDGYLFLKSDERLDSGDFVPCLVTGASEYDLTGEQTDGMGEYHEFT